MQNLVVKLWNYLWFTHKNLFHVFPPSKLRKTNYINTYLCLSVKVFVVVLSSDTQTIFLSENIKNINGVSELKPVLCWNQHLLHLAFKTKNWNLKVPQMIYTLDVVFTPIFLFLMSESIYLWFDISEHRTTSSPTLRTRMVTWYNDGNYILETDHEKQCL